MDTSTVQRHLNTLGWKLVVDGDNGPKTQKAVANFQAGFTYWDLVIDGQHGPNTWKALNHSLSAPRRGQGSAAPHFHFSEFACKCGGRYASCERIKADRATIRGLEKYRAALGTGVGIVSGYRCPSHNRAVGGASQSRHMAGDAVDIQPVMSRTGVKRLAVFTGIGYQSSNGRVRHVDTRPGSVASPTMWPY